MGVTQLRSLQLLPSYVEGIESERAEEERSTRLHVEEGSTTEICFLPVFRGISIFRGGERQLNSAEQWKIKQKVQIVVLLSCWAGLALITGWKEAREEKRRDSLSLPGVSEEDGKWYTGWQRRATHFGTQSQCRSRQFHKCVRKLFEICQKTVSYKKLSENYLKSVTYMS